MTENEYGSLFVAFLEASNVVVTNYITITFAMLATTLFSYLASVVFFFVVRIQRHEPAGAA